MDQSRTYYSTRDLLMFAALAALGGVTSTYVNTIGDFFQSIFGFAGTTQWAAGLHVVWLTLAVGLTRKQGAGTMTGLLKGGVELLTGNTHGLLILLVDVAAGLLVDLGFLPFRNKDSLAAYCLAGGLASASNIFVFQLFASVPSDTMAYWAVLLVAAVAFASGVLFAGVLARSLVRTLRRAGVVKDQPPVAMSGKVYPIFLLGTGVLAIALTLFLRQALQGPATVLIGGTVEAAYDYPSKHDDIEPRTVEGTLREVTADYTGIPVRELVDRAQPQPNASSLLVRASDGYAFFISMAEVRENDSLLLAAQTEGDEPSYNLVGPNNAKAWVRGVSELVVIGPSTLKISGALGKPNDYDPDDWQFEMDSTRLDLGEGAGKYQGTSLGQVLLSMEPRPEATTVVVETGSEPISLPLADVMDDDLRIFLIVSQNDLAFALARMDGQVLAQRITGIEVR